MSWLSLWSLGPGLSRADLDELKALGIAGVEVWAEHPRAPQHLIWARQAGLQIGLHLPFHDLNLASSDQVVARHAETVLRRWLDRVGRAGGEHAVLHPGFARASEQRAQAVEDVRRRLPALQQTALANGVTLLVENLAPDPLHYTHPVASDLTEWISLLKSTSTKACLDIGHLALAGRSLAAAFSALGAHLGSVHCSETDGYADAHLFPGDGAHSAEAFPQLVRQAGFIGPVVYEINPYCYSKSSLQARLRGVCPKPR